jgi:hypothetical protein
MVDVWVRLPLDALTTVPNGGSLQTVHLWDASLENWNATLPRLARLFLTDFPV